MINTLQFRVGNFVKDEISGEWMKVCGVDPENVSAVVINREKYPLPDGWQMAPIELTREILLQFGFEYEGATTLTKDGFPVYFKCWDGHAPSAQCFYLNGQISVMCAYVHELQNLYFAFTRTELNIKL